MATKPKSATKAPAKKPAATKLAPKRALAKKAPTVKAGTNPEALAARVQIFVEEYIRNGGNARQAGLAAGYSANSVDAQVSRMLKEPKVAAAIKARRAELAAKYSLNAEAVIKNLAQALYFDPRKLFNENGSLKAVKDLDDDTAAVLSSLEVFEEFAGRGDERELVGFTKKLKWLDRNVAREQAMKHLGLFKADNEQKNLLADLDRDEVKAIVEHLRGLAQSRVA